MNINRFLVLSLFFIFLAASPLAAQQRDCHKIVLPAINYDEERIGDLPEEKMREICDFSYYSFFVVDEIPSNAVVYNISDVVSVRDSVAFPSDYVVDLSTLSIYAYNFEDFRFKHENMVVYFRTPASEHQYLALRPYLQALRLTSGEETLSE